MRLYASLETSFEPGEVMVVAYRDGTAVTRTALQSGTGLARLDVRVELIEIGADDIHLAYIDITLVDENGRLHYTEDRAATIEVQGPEGPCSANPRT